MGPELYRDRDAGNSDPGQMPEIRPKGDDPPLRLAKRNRAPPRGDARFPQLFSSGPPKQTGRKDDYMPLL